MTICMECLCDFEPSLAGQVRCPKCAKRIARARMLDLERTGFFRTLRRHRNIDLPSASLMKVRRRLRALERAGAREDA